MVIANAGSTQAQDQALVLTPGGRRLLSTVHLLESGQHVSGKGGRISILDTASGIVLKDLGEFKRDATANRAVRGKVERDVPGNLVNAYQASAAWSAEPLAGQSWPIVRFSSKWTVPPPPATNNSQTIYIWNGLAGTLTGDLLQPVLQWGESAIGGGPYWAIANWYVIGTTAVITPKAGLVRVNPSDVIEGVMTLTGTHPPDTGGFPAADYHLSFTGHPASDITVKDIELLMNAEEVLEVHNVTSCSDYPNTSLTAFFDVQIDIGQLNTPGAPIDSGSASIVWNSFAPRSSCNTGCNIVSNDSPGGEVDIIYRNPQKGHIGGSQSLTSLALGSSDLRVYCLGEDTHNVYQLAWNGSDWTTTDTKLSAAAGSALTCLYCDGKEPPSFNDPFPVAGPQVYYQDDDNFINQLSWNGSTWTNLKFYMKRAATGSPLPCLYWGPDAAYGSEGPTGSYVFFLDDNNEIWQIWTNGPDIIAYSPISSSPIKAAAGSALACLHGPGPNGSGVRMYYQDENNHIHENVYTPTYEPDVDTGAVAIPKSPLTCLYDNESNPNIYYLADTAGGIAVHRLVLNGSEWVSGPIKDSDQTPAWAAAESQLSCVNAGKFGPRVYYLSATVNGNPDDSAQRSVGELSWSDSGWIFNNTPAIAAKTSPLTCAWQQESGSHILYLDRLHVVKQLAGSNGSWFLEGF
jgi:hypothetical protein